MFLLPQQMKFGPIPSRCHIYTAKRTKPRTYETTTSTTQNKAQNDNIYKVRQKNLTIFKLR